jgi:hypothetical protein
MGGRSLAPFLLVAAAVVGACSDGANDVPTAPEFAPKPASCNFTTISSLVKTEFGASSDEAGLATDMKNAGAQTALATSIGYQILASIGTKYDGSQASTSNASALTVALLKCMDIGTASVPDTAVIKIALASSGAYGVRPLVADDKDPVTSHDGVWLLEPPATQTWQSMLPAGTSSILVYGVPVTNGSFTKDSPKSGVFDWTTKPQVTFNDPGIVIGQCEAESHYLQHNPAGITAEVLGFVTPSCFFDDGLGLREREPRSFAERMFRLFAPAPAYAALLTTTGSGGSKRTLSPFQVIDPNEVRLTTQFNWKKSGFTVGQPFASTTNPLEYQIQSGAGTKFLQDYVLIWLEALGNQGTNVAVCNNWAYTNANGVAQFPVAYLNKAGGYTMVSKTTGTSSKPGVTGSELPSVPPGSSLNSPLINVKNGTPGTCDTYHPGVDPLPPVPGPNGFKPLE